MSKVLDHYGLPTLYYEEFDSEGFEVTNSVSPLDEWYPRVAYELGLKKVLEVYWDLTDSDESTQEEGPLDTPLLEDLVEVASELIGSHDQRSRRNKGQVL
jgi:hypothetical protein